jgi:phosphoribosyl 1,2-cyclic phosphodiesterase
MRGRLVREMIIQSFGSGSSGNAAFVRGGGASILIDCGIGPRMLQRFLQAHGCRLKEIDAVLLTHEHDDHVRGLAALRAAGRPIHATPGTSIAIGLGAQSNDHLVFDRSMTIGGLEVRALQTSHDAAEPCGFTLSDGANRATVLTDLGETDDCCLDLLAASDLIVIEANHDVHMLKSGPYPVYLKQRVLSARGHLSNVACGSFLGRALANSRRSKTIWLAHLSATNNRPDLAVRTVQEALARLPVRHKVIALPRRDVGPTWRPFC